ncbi:MAG TPA: hypothetical protein VFQ85_09555 [Mycobacteriales bacterium]|jgi:hypothetical protein|nr:hypothetical protein [Mycobacteriales bacterium]
MTPDQILAAFGTVASTRSLTGDSLPGARDLLARLAVDSLTVTGGIVAPRASGATLTATTAFLRTQWTMVLTGTSVEGTDDVDLTLDLTGAQADPWTFGQAFGDLPASARPRDDGSGLSIGASVVAPLVLRDAAFTATNDVATLPRLAGTFPLRGDVAAPGSDVLARYADYFGDLVYLDGTVDLTGQGHPRLELRGVAPGLTMTLGNGLAVPAVGVVLTTKFENPLPLGAEEDALLSAALVFADVTLPPRTTVTLCGPLLFGNALWPLEGVVVPPMGIAGGVETILTIAGVRQEDAGQFALPAGIAPLDAFKLTDVSFGLMPPSDGTPPSVSYAMVGIATTEKWNPPVPYLTIDAVGTRWRVTFVPGAPSVTGSVYGRMTLGPKPLSSLGAVRQSPRHAPSAPADASSGITLTVTLSLPDLGFSAVADPFDISLGAALKTFLGDSVPDLPAPHAHVTTLSAYSSLLRKDFGAELAVTGDWSLTANDVTFTLTGAQLQVAVSQSQVSGTIVCLADLEVPGGDPVELLAQVTYAEKAWELSAIMRGTVDVPRLVYALLRATPPPWIKGTFTLSDLEVRYSTAAGNPFSARGTIGIAVPETLLGIRMCLTLTVAVERTVRTTTEHETYAVALRDTPMVDAAAVVTGSLAGTFVVGGLTVTASVSVSDVTRSYTFAIAYRDVSLTAVTASDSTGGTAHQVVKIRMTGTLGDLVTYLVSLANPNANFRLDPPWDFLNAIVLDGYELVVDPTLQAVSLTRDVSLNLGFVDVSSVGVRYERSSGTPSVSFVLTATMLGDTAPRTTAWDAVNQAPPQVPGKGAGLFSLNYLGLGQHVSPKNVTSYTSIAPVLDALAKSMRPAKDPAKVPVDPAEFDPSSQWLFAIDATVMNTVSVKVLMHDPDMYGAIVALSGDQAGSLAGLSLELLYKKVTDDIGMFHARLQIPDAFRHLQFGAVAVTLGIVSLDVYTNGNFRVDLGFPANNDFSTSFAVEAGIFNGRGGLYFAVLNGATSTRVPRITNGTFSPVLELGVGLSVGVGRTFEAGPLSAGMYLNLVVVFEGALAWFHPDDANAATDLYYWCRGTAGIVGKIYGSVDFKVISVDVSVSVSAMATLELAAYAATVVSLDLDLRASASVKIVFIRISFSFSLTLHQSFVIGSASTPPWRVASGTTSVRGAAGPRAAVAAPAAGNAPYRLVFDKKAVVFPGGGKRTAYLTAAPAYTVANVPVRWGSTPPAAAAPDYRIVVMLLTDNAVPVGARTIAETRRPDVSRNARAAEPADASLNVLAEAMLRWSLNALGIVSPTAVVTRDDLATLVAQLAMDESAETGFTWANLDCFLGNNVSVVVSGTPAPDPAGNGPDGTSGTPFPMIPVLGWTATGLPVQDDATREFWHHQWVDATYEAGALAYFAPLDPRPGGDRPSRQAPDAGGDAPEPMATFVLRDYFRLLARAATQAAADLLTAYPHTVADTDSLRSIAGSFETSTVPYVVVPGDSVDVAAAALGVTAAELVALNTDVAATLAAATPGETVDVVVGVTPQSLALANADWAVAPSVPLTLGALPVQVREGQSLAALGQPYGVDVAALLPTVADRADLLRAGATMAMPSWVYPDPAGLSVDRVAALYWVRLGRVLPEDVPLSPWYASAIRSLNPGLASPLPATVRVPAGYESEDGRPWPTVAGDTVESVAAYAALSQNVVAGTPYAAWLGDVRAANATPPAAGVALPATNATVLARDTLASLRDRLLLDATTFADRVADADVLVPLTTVTLPDATATTGTGLTLLTLAQSFGLGLEDLAARIAGDVGVLATDPKHDLTVPDVPAMGLDRLTAAMHGGAAMATVSGQVSRFMMSGLRLPAPVEDGDVYRATGPMTGLYELVGQQVAGPPPPETGDGTVVTFTLTKGPPAAWLSFSGSVVVGGDDDAALHLARNPGLASGPPAGLVALTEPAPSAVVTITAKDLRDCYPATLLTPDVTEPLAPLPLSHELGTRHRLAHVVTWQTSTLPALPVAPPAGSRPSLWPLPADLVATAASGISTATYVLEQTTPQTGPTATWTGLRSYAWATLVDFQVRRIAGLAGTTEVIGADPATRQRLADVVAYLAATPTDSATLTLLWQLPPTPGQAPGLTSVALDPASTFVVQTNLTTETRSGLTRAAGAETDPTAGQHYASIADSERFLTLLWECSVVGGGGYWMRMRGATQDVPDSIFDQDGLATLTLLVQLATQTRPSPDLHLRSFTNVAVVGDGVDPSSVSLAARAEEPPELMAAASVDPGQVGFRLCVRNPGEDESADGRLRRLYGLLGFRLDETEWFAGSPESRPVTSRPAPAYDPLGVAVPEKDDETVWDLRRVVDASRFARRRLPPLPSAPSPEEDPYAGTVAGARTQVSLWFQDVFGNVSGDPATLPIRVRYTDPLAGPGGWPSTTLRYTVAAKVTEPGADLVVRVDLQATAYQPAASAAGDTAAAKAARDAARYAGVYFQVMQPDVTVSLLTSLRQEPGTGPQPLPVDAATLRHYVMAAHAYLGAVATCGTATAGGATVDALCASYGLDPGTLGDANAGAALSSLLAATSVAVPVSAAFRTGDTVQALAGDDAVAVLTDEDNVVLPLLPGVELVTPGRTETVPTATATAAGLAAEWHCTLDTLVGANASTTGLLTPGFVFDCYGAKVKVATEGAATETTLALVATAFAGQGVQLTPAQVVGLNADVPGMFREGAPLSVQGYVVTHGDTLEKNGSGAAAAALAPLNTSTPNLFPPGTSLFLRTRASDVPPGVTLGEFAVANTTTPGALLRHNGGTTVTSAVVPGTWTWCDQPGALRVPYTVARNDSLTAIAARALGADPRLLVAGNAAMPGAVAAGVTIEAGGRSATTSAPSSFETVAALFTPPLSTDELADAIDTRTDVLVVGALLLTPPGVLPASPGGALTASDAAAPWPGVGAVSLLAANAGTPGLLVAGAPLAAAGTDHVEHVAVHDTLTAVVERFRRAGVATTVDALLAANKDVAFVRAGATVLVPPATATLSAALSTPAGDGVTWTFPAPVFPVSVTVRVARDPDLVDPALTATAAVADTVVPVERQADDAQAGALTLAHFAEQVEDAIPPLRLATGTGAGGAPGTDVWAVVFGAGGVADVHVFAPPPVPPLTTPQPRTFAIRPLATTLTSRDGITVPTFEPATGRLGKDETRTFQGIDLEVWARAFLSDVELMLTAAYARGAYALNRPALDKLVAAKKTLAGAAAKGLWYVLEGAAPPDGDDDPDLRDAVEALRQRLLVSLTQGYDTSAVIQYDTTVASPWGTTVARLSGNAVVDFSSVPDNLRTLSISNGKVSLANGDGRVTFLVRVPDVAAHEELDLTLDYTVVELEHDIAPEVEGYERSDWLTFALPVRSGDPAALRVDLGSPRVPVPLRAYPPMPLLVEHAAVTPDTAATLDDAVHWRYRLTVRHQSAQQDRLRFRVTYNQPPPPLTDVRSREDLFRRLAGYTNVSGPLLSLLAGVVASDDAAQPRRDVLRAALDTFATLADAVATAWDGYWTDPSPDQQRPEAKAAGGGPEPDVYEYAIGLDDDHEGEYTRLRLTLTAHTGAGTVGRPDIVCFTADGTRHVLTPLAREKCPCPPDATGCWCYAFPPGVPAFALTTYELTFPPVHVASYQNADADVWVTRNSSLLGDDGPATVEAFVYRTPEMGYPAPVVPFIDITEEIHIGDWPTAPLGQVFAMVFDGYDTGRTVAVGVRYAYTLVPATPDTKAVEALLPVVQSTNGTYDAATIPTLTQHLEEWRGRVDPSPDGGAWAFWVSLYSSVDTSLRRPVLQLKRLTSRL